MAGRRVLLLNPNSSNAATESMAGFAREALGSEWTVETATNPDAPIFIADPAGEAAAVAGLMRLLDDGLDPCEGVMLSAFIDPGRAELRARLDVPVIGLAEAAMQAAARIGRFAVLAATPQLEATIETLAACYGVADQLAGILKVAGDPAALMADPPTMLTTLRGLLDEAAARGDLDAVIIGAGPLADLIRALRDESPLPLIEPVPTLARAMRDVLEGRAGSPVA